MTGLPPFATSEEPEERSHEPFCQATQGHRQPGDIQGAVTSSLTYELMGMGVKPYRASVHRQKIRSHPRTPVFYCRASLCADRVARYATVQFVERQSRLRTPGLFWSQSGLWSVPEVPSDRRVTLMSSSDDCSSLVSTQVSHRFTACPIFFCVGSRISCDRLMRECTAREAFTT